MTSEQELRAKPLQHVGLCVGFSDADHSRTAELFLASASEKRQGRKSRGGAASMLAGVYGDLMPAVFFGTVVCLGFNVWMTVIA